MSKKVTISTAVLVGLLVVNGPVLFIIVGPTLLFLYALNRGLIDDSLVGLLILVLSFCLAWLWWSLIVPRWRLWAFENVEDIPELKRRAVAAGLTWRDGHMLGKTEIKSQRQRDRENALDR